MQVLLPLCKVLAAWRVKASAISSHGAKQTPLALTRCGEPAGGKSFRVETPHLLNKKRPPKACIRMG